MLSQQFDRYMNLEFNGSISGDKVGMSRDDRRALASHEHSVRLTSGHYEIDTLRYHGKRVHQTYPTTGLWHSTD